MEISYNQIEQIIETHLVVYKGKVYETLEDMQTFPDNIHLKDEGITREEFWDIYERLYQSLRGR